MEISGKILALGIKEDLQVKISALLKRNIQPALAVILTSSDRNTASYVRQKQKIGEELSVDVEIIKPDLKIDSQEFQNIINKLNSDPKIHGIIIQRPALINISSGKLVLMVAPSKDIDGFHPNSLFDPPIGLAVLKILKKIQSLTNLTLSDSERVTEARYPVDVTFNPAQQEGDEWQALREKDFINWLKAKKILVIGRGETGGKPVVKTLEKNNITNLEIADSKTKNLKEMSLASDIIISCVGKPNIVRHDMVRSSAILIGVGMHYEKDRFQADYEEELISQKVAFYTPVPGGVGPINVACLFENLLNAIDAVVTSTQSI